MADHPGFLADIFAHPDDDTPRLIYADWLDDNGQGERAEFIRVQCRLHRETGCHTEPDTVGETFCLPGNGRLGRMFPCPYCTLMRREADLWKEMTGPGTFRLLPELSCSLAEHGVHLLIPQNSLATADVNRVMVRRGFPEEAQVTCKQWLACGPDLVQAGPVRRVVLRGKKPCCLGRVWRFFLLGNDLVASQSDCLPYQLAPYLTGERPADYDLDYTTEQAALDALSDACLAWARDEVPALPT